MSVFIVLMFNPFLNRRNFILFSKMVKCLPYMIFVVLIIHKIGFMNIILRYIVIT